MPDGNHGIANAMNRIMMEEEEGVHTQGPEAPEFKVNKVEDNSFFF